MPKAREFHGFTGLRIDGTIRTVHNIAYYDVRNQEAHCLTHSSDVDKLSGWGVEVVPIQRLITMDGRSDPQTIIAIVSEAVRFIVNADNELEKTI